MSTRFRACSWCPPEGKQLRRPPVVASQLPGGIHERVGTAVRVQMTSLDEHLRSRGSGQFLSLVKSCQPIRGNRFVHQDRQLGKIRGDQVHLAYQFPQRHLGVRGYQQLRSIYHAKSEKDRARVAEILTSFPSCPIPKDRTTRPDTTAVEGRDPGELRHPRCF